MTTQQSDALLPAFSGDDSAWTPTSIQSRILAWRTLAGEESHRELARRVGCDESTVRYHLQNERFRALFERAAEAPREVVRALRVSGELRSLLTLHELQEDAEVSPAVKREAANSLLVHLSREKDGQRQDVSLELMMQRWLKEAEEQNAVDSEATHLN